MALMAPKPDAIAEWTWMWARMPVALIVGYAAPRVLIPGFPGTLVMWSVGVMLAYSVAIFGLLRKGHLTAAFWAGVVLDSTVLIFTWHQVLIVPGVGDQPSDLYLILFPFLVAMVFRMGAAPGAIYSVAIIALMAAADTYYQGAGSYVMSQLAIRVFFLILTAMWASVIVFRVQARNSALLDSESRFHRLFDIAPAGIVISDERRRITEVNGAFVAMLGYTEHDLIGSRFSEFEQRAVLRESTGNYARLMSGDIDSYRSQRAWVRRDGHAIWTDTESAAVRDYTGKFLYAVRVVSDISAFIALNHAKDEFVATTSHELRTPLTAIHAAVGLAASGALGEVPDRIARQLELAQANSNRLLTLVNDILLLEQVNLGRLSVKLAPVDLCGVVEEVTDALEPVARERSIALTTDCPALIVDCDGARIAQVLTNIIGNSLNIAPSDSTITVAAARSETAVTVTVADQGPGVPQEQLQSIFEPFERVARTYSGTGLGLAIAKGIVEQHGGTIWATNGENTGAIFSFSLPLTQPDR
mgnify:CR=1 FL=1